MKLITYITMLALLFTTTITNVYAVSDDKKPKKERIAAMTDEQRAARLTEIRNRVNEIKAIDRSELKKADRKALKNELKDLNKEARANKGVYLSVGAIIIIILLLILIL